MTAPGTDAPHDGRPVAAVVTGAAKGIGLAVAQRLLADGAVVVGLDRDERGLADAREQLGEGFIPLGGDVSDWSAHERAADAAQEAGRLAWWVNNAGIDWVGGAHEVTPEHIAHGLGVLQLGTMYGAAIAVRRMLPARRGSIVNVASIQGVCSFPRYYTYGAAKGAIIMASRSIAVDYAPHGIRCNTVLPGVVETPMTYETLPQDLPRDEAMRREGELAPMARVGQAGEVADAVAFLLGDGSSYITGTEVVVDGGATARCFAYPPLELEEGSP